MIRATVEEIGHSARFVMRAEGFEATGDAPLCALCRKLVEANPDYADHELAVHDGATGRLRFTVKTIGRAARWTLGKSDGDRSGYAWQRYVPFPKDAFGKAAE